MNNELEREDHDLYRFESRSWNQITCSKGTIDQKRTRTDRSRSKPVESAASDTIFRLTRAKSPSLVRKRHRAMRPNGVDGGSRLSNASVAMLTYRAEDHGKREQHYQDWIISPKHSRGYIWRGAMIANDACVTWRITAYESERIGSDCSWAGNGRKWSETRSRRYSPGSGRVKEIKYKKQELAIFLFSPQSSPSITTYNINESQYLPTLRIDYNQQPLLPSTESTSNWPQAL